MWPFGSTRPSLRVGDGAVVIDTVATVTGPSTTVSPVSGKAAIFFHYRVEEHVGDRASFGSATELGEVVLGDLVRFLVELEDGPVPAEVAVRRAVFSFLEEAPAQPLVRSIPELTPLLLSRYGGAGTLCYRETLVPSGRRFRFRGCVERVRAVAADAYRSLPAERLVVSPAVALRLDELGGAPESGA